MTSLAPSLWGGGGDIMVVWSAWPTAAGTNIGVEIMRMIKQGRTYMQLTYLLGQVKIAAGQVEVISSIEIQNFFE